jgi:hypothetical protein
VTKGQGVGAIKALVIGRTVVQESSNAATLLGRLVGVNTTIRENTHTSTVRINHKCKAVKLADSINARGTDPGLAIFGIP